MPKDFKSDHPTLAGRLPFRKHDTIVSPPPACLVMAGWSEDGWTPPPRFGGFPILAVCPEAPAYFAAAAHFTLRDLRAIVAAIRLDVDPRDSKAVYEAILRRVEDEPWVLPVLETIVSDKRLGGRAQRNRKHQKTAQVLSKLPLIKLRLKNHPELHSRLGELTSLPVAPDVAVGAFCEYAITSYFERVDTMDAGDVTAEAMKILVYDGPEEIVETNLGSLDAVDDWTAHGARIMEWMKQYPDATSELIQQHVTRTLRAISCLLDEASQTETFDLIAHLSVVGSEMAKRLHVPRRDKVLAQIDRFKIDYDRDSVSDDAVSTLSAALDEGLATQMRAREMAIAAMEEAVAELREQIQSATEEENFTLLAELAPKAKTAKEALAAEREACDKVVDLLRAILSGAETEQEALLEALHAASGEAPHDDDEEPDDPNDETGPVAVEDDKISTDEPVDGDPVSQAAEVVAVTTEVLSNEANEKQALAAEAPITFALHGIDIAHGADDAPAKAGPTPFVVDSEPSEDQISEPPRVEPEAIEAAADDEPTQADDDRAREVTILPVSREVLADLVRRDLVGIAAEAADAFEAHGQVWALEASALRTAAGSRAPHREYGFDTERFLSIANRAMGERLGALGSVLVLGALIRPAIIEKSSGFRANLRDLCRGSLGQHLQQATEAIADLDYDFPPDADELARISGAPRAPQKKRIAAQLAEWCDACAQKTSRWPFATAFMHYVVSENGPIGSARAAIESGAANAVVLARKAVEDLSSQSDIDDRSVEFAAVTRRNDARLHPKGIEYLYRQFDEPLGLLDGWVRAAEREHSQGQKSQARVRTIVGNLQSRLEKAIQGLHRETRKEDDPLHTAVAYWIIKQIEETLRALQGDDTGSFATLEEALTAERDLLPAAVRDVLDQPDFRFDAFLKALTESGIPSPDVALLRARQEAAFDTAVRLASRFDIDAHDDIRNDMVSFAETWQTEIERRERRLKRLAKVDYNHQDLISSRLKWCELALARLTAIKDGSEIHDLADVQTSTIELDDISSEIEANIRSDQTERIWQYRTDQNSEEAAALLSAFDELTIEAIEDRIAQLRDGRSAATFQTELEGMVADFTPEFLALAASPDWPRSPEAFRKALSREGPLFIEEDRRAAGLEFLATYRAIAGSEAGKQPAGGKVREFFEEVGFENVKIHDLRPLGRTGSWQCTLFGGIRSDGWFLPPIFGSRATAGFRLLLVGQDVLPEVTVKALIPEVPAIILFSGVADLAKRQELAERLRAGAIPTLVIDEALVAFTATRRYTRARTIFECGLPFGRVEPYTTDAGQLPPEMFFGREEEIRFIMSKTADGCLVYGGRQLGKSALLGHVERTRHKPVEDQFVIRREVKSLGNSEKTSEIWAHLANMLSPEIVKAGSRTAEAVSRDIRTWITKKPKGRIVCMFDEADRFMDADTRDDYPELSKLKELMEDTGRAFKVVFAGLHNVQRMHRQPNSPLAHLGQPICIGPLNRTEADKRAAYDLVVAPMRAAGFRFETREAVEEILAWANYYPSLIQEYMKGLLATLHGAGSGKAYKLPSDGPLWPIASEALFTHRGFHQIESRIRDKFHLTLNLDPRYALVAYTLGRLNVEGKHQARVTGFRPDELLEEARIFWPKTSELPSQAAFEALLEELFDLGVLGRVPIPQTKRYRYLLGSRQVAAMLGSEEDIYHALAEIEEKDPTVAYDRSIHRRRYAPANLPGLNQNDWPYAPLTDLQIERIVDASSETVPVQIVCGLELLGLSKVGQSLKRISETGRLPGAPNEETPVHIANSTRDLRAQIDQARPGGRQLSLVVYQPENAKEAADVVSWLERQPRVLGSRVRPLIILDAADAEMRGLANRRAEQSQFLSAWGAEMVRAHLHQIEKTELDTPSLREIILEVTGGIPTETVKLIKEMRVALDPMEIAQSWQPVLRPPPGILQGALGRALRILELADGGDYETLDELMREDTGCDLVDIGPDLRATGLVTSWNPKTGHIRRSALGDFIRKLLEKT